MHAFAGCNTITFESLDVGSSFSHIPSSGNTGQFAYGCHRVKVLIRGWSCLGLEGIPCIKEYRPTLRRVKDKQCLCCRLRWTLLLF